MFDIITDALSNLDNWHNYAAFKNTKLRKHFNSKNNKNMELSKHFNSKKQNSWSVYLIIKVAVL